MTGVSVIMPVYNVGDKPGYLHQALKSLLHQTHRDLEILVMDDGSTDNTHKLLAKYGARIKVLRLEHGGIAKALNAGLEAAANELVARHDADDWSVEHRIQTQVDYMRRHPQTRILGSRIQVVDQDSKPMFVSAHPLTDSEIKEFMSKGCPFAHGSVMYRRSDIMDLGGYSTDPVYDYTEDYELWSRAAHLQAYNLTEPLYFYRHHAAGVSQKHRAQQARSTEIIQARFR